MAKNRKVSEPTKVVTLIIPVRILESIRNEARELSFSTQKDISYCDLIRERLDSRSTTK